LTEKGCTGAPDVIIEILSPSTAAKDMKEKLHLYETHGVKEYWIVDPNNKSVMIFKLIKSGTYGKPEIYVGNDSIDVERLEGLSINLDKIFE
jgi:Uma2 family endonuclease